MASDGVMVSVTVSPLFPFPAPLTLSTTVLRVGTVSSWVTEEPSVVAVTATPAFPALSEKPSETTTAVSASLSVVITAQVQVFPPVLVIVSAFVASTPDPNSISQVGVPIVSDAVNVIVTVSPSFDRDAESPFPAIVTDDNVGTVSSWVTALLSVVAVTAVPALPLASVKPIEKTTDPSASSSWAITVHCQLLPPPGLVIDSAFVASLPAVNSISQVGVPMVSEEVNARVIVFPSMLRSLSALFEFSVTDVRVGAVMSAVYE